MTSVSRAAAGRIVAAAGLTAASNRDISESEVRAAVRAAKNVVVVGIVGRCALDVVESDAADGDAVCGFTSGTAVEVVLLDVDAVVGDAGDSDVLVDDVADLFTLSVPGCEVKGEECHVINLHCQWYRHCS
jgi:hypothetical protein